MLILGASSVSGFAGCGGLFFLRWGLLISICAVMLILIVPFWSCRSPEQYSNKPSGRVVCGKNND